MNYKEIKEKLTLTERAKQHQLLHPNDTNTPRVNRGIHWSKRTKKDKKLKEFYKTHVWVGNGYPDCRWVSIGEEE